MKNISVGIVGGGPTGLFMSKILSKMNITNTVYSSKAKEEQVHPSAHFINAKTMKQFNTTDSSINEKIYNYSNNLKNWGSIIQTNNYLSNTPLFSDQFYQNEFNNENINADQFYEENFNGIKPAHISQDKLVKILTQNNDKIVYDTQINNISYQNNIVSLQSNGKEQKHDYVIVAAGANYSLSKELKINQFFRDRNPFDMDISFLNVHFKSKRLAEYFRFNKMESMLSFCQSPQLSVLISHDLSQSGNFVLQIPIGSDIQNYEDYAKKAIDYHQKEIDNVEIMNINTWKINVQIANEFFNREQDNRVIQIGDIAHQTPPSGGFGLNLGIHDAFELGSVFNQNLNSISRIKNDLENWETKRKQASFNTISTAVKFMRDTLNTPSVLGLNNLVNYKYEQTIGKMAGQEQADFLKNTQIEGLKKLGEQDGRQFGLEDSFKAMTRLPLQMERQEMEELKLDTPIQQDLKNYYQ